MDLEKIAVAIIVLSFIVAIVSYPAMPDRIPTHWNYKGDVDGYSQKAMLFFLPFLTAVMFLFLKYIPKFDPLYKNVEKFEKTWNESKLVFVSFFSAIFVVSILFAYGWVNFNFNYFVVPLFSILFFFMGDLVEKAEMNWFIGIKTPWTLSSEKVWKQVHLLGGKMFKWSAVVGILGLFFVGFEFLFILVPGLFVSLFLVIYSYVLFLQEKKSKPGAKAGAIKKIKKARKSKRKSKR